jgi:SHAQKYF class myb-like DNA-binding protein
MFRNEDSFITNSTKLTNNNSENVGRSLRQKSKKDYQNLPDSFLVNSSQGLNNGRWSMEEHKRFITGVFKHGNNWKGIVDVIGTRTCAQARSHGQKFFTKLQKMDLEGITDDMCNVKYLHILYTKVFSKEESDELFLLLTDIAFSKMEKQGDESMLMDGETFSSTMNKTLKMSESSYGMISFNL